MPKTEDRPDLITREVRKYFAQSKTYGSLHRDRFVRIADMHPVHARNAAQKMIRDCCVWADAAGIDGVDELLWLISTPLHRALVDRAVQR